MRLILLFVRYSFLLLSSVSVLWSSDVTISKGLQSYAEVAHPRGPGVRQARATSISCKGHQSSKAAVAAQRNAIAAEALFGRLDNAMQSNSFTGRKSKVKPLFLCSVTTTKPIAKTCFGNSAGQAQQERMHHQRQLLASCGLHSKCCCLTRQWPDPVVFPCCPEFWHYSVKSAKHGVTVRNAYSTCCRCMKASCKCLQPVINNV